MFNLFGCCSRNVLRKAGRPYLSERKNWGALDGASWCRHDPAIPYQVLTPQLGSGNLLGFGLRGSGARLSQAPVMPPPSAHDTASSFQGERKRVVFGPDWACPVVAALWPFCQMDFRALVPAGAWQTHGW